MPRRRWLHRPGALALEAAALLLDEVVAGLETTESERHLLVVDELSLGLAPGPTWPSDAPHTAPGVSTHFLRRARMFAPQGMPITRSSRGKALSCAHAWRALGWRGACMPRPRHPTSGPPPPQGE